VRDEPANSPAWRILACDDDVIAVAKPRGMLVVPGRDGAAGDDVLRGALERHLGAPVWVVHRIDRVASGVVLFAPSADAHRFLSMAFEAGAVRRVYRAWVLGVPDPPQATIDLPIREGRKGRMKGAPDGKPSRTDYRLLRAVEGAALVEANLRSGRRHQIRLHLAYRGHPILFDELYAGPRLPALRDLRHRLGLPSDEAGIRLHAAEVAWRGRNGLPRSVTCEPPEGFDPFG
jgi:23S rRNA-/tRNA-specific pseudouridylate synthase